MSALSDVRTYQLAFLFLLLVFIGHGYVLDFLRTLAGAVSKRGAILSALSAAEDRATVADARAKAAAVDLEEKEKWLLSKTSDAVQEEYRTRFYLRDDSGRFRSPAQEETHEPWQEENSKGFYLHGEEETPVIWGQ